MSLFANPAEHAANPPDTWVAAKQPSNIGWSLHAPAAGYDLGPFRRKRDALEAKESGFYVDLYAKESRWYAGESVDGWAPYVAPLSMIPTVADTESLQTYTDNILTVWHAATPDQNARGRSWYPTARQLAEMMSNGNVRAGAGVLAALSPQKAWEYNVKLAADAFTNGEARGQVGDACRKAERIMLGEDPLSVLPEDSKTWNFFRCIIDPADGEAVVVDRHAHDIAVGTVYGSADRGLSNKRRYATLALAYRMAAHQLDEIPSVVQAVTWVCQVERERD